MLILDIVDFVESLLKENVNFNFVINVETEEFEEPDYDELSKSDVEVSIYDKDNDRYYTIACPSPANNEDADLREYMTRSIFLDLDMKEKMPAMDRILTLKSTRRTVILSEARYGSILLPVPDHYFMGILLLESTEKKVTAHSTYIRKSSEQCSYSFASMTLDNGIFLEETDDESTRIEWMDSIHSVMELYDGPLAPKDADRRYLIKCDTRDVYHGKHIWAHSDLEHVAVLVNNHWICVSRKWALSHPDSFDECTANEIRMYAVL